MTEREIMNETRKERKKERKKDINQETKFSLINTCNVVVTVMGKKFNNEVMKYLYVRIAVTRLS
jgi:hypothetical protein